MSHASARRIRRRKIANMAPNERPQKWGWLGEVIAGTDTGRMAGTKVPDFSNLFKIIKPGLLRLRKAGTIWVTHFRHPTKRRTRGRVCTMKFFRAAKGATS